MRVRHPKNTWADDAAACPLGVDALRKLAMEKEVKDVLAALPGTTWFKRAKAHARSLRLASDAMDTS